MMASRLFQPRFEHLRRMLLEASNYEEAWGDATKESSESERDLRDALVATLELQETLLSAHGHSDGLNAPDAIDFIRNCVTFGHPESGFIATTNYDCHLERLESQLIQRIRIRHLGGPGGRINVEGDNWRASYTSDASTTGPTTLPRPQTNEIGYLKLHGSLNWDHHGERVLVSGTRKDGQIARFPVLKAINDALDSEVSKGNVDVVSIGFSFTDSHLLDRLEKVCDDAWRIFVINPEHPSGLVSRLSATHPKLGRAVRYYLPVTLPQLFPARGGQAQTLRRKEFERVLFNQW